MSVADIRTRFMKWADAHQREKLGEDRAGAGEGGIIAAPGLDQRVTTPAEQPHRP
jgi:hypothetical protein